jgi:hypothetical protein
MHKLILTLGILIQSVVTLLGQSSLYGRASLFQLGEVNQYTNKIEWIGEPSPVDILVQVNKGELIVHSEEHQVYQIIQRMGHQDNTTMYRATDKRGIKCLVYITAIDREYGSISNEIVVSVQYSDYAWMYLCTEGLD